VEAKELTDTISGLILLAIALFLLLLVLGLLAWFIWSRRRRSADGDDVSPT
jgi:heme/copper-type cytochrome/quinol oxidase subunit 2